MTRKKIKTVAKKPKKAPPAAPMVLLDENEPAAEYVDIHTLKGWANNPRINKKTIPKVMKSIQRFGFGTPIVARKANREIMAGHTRVAAAEQLGMTRVPCRFRNLTEAEAHAYAIADNRTQEFSTWDQELRDNALNDLRNDMPLFEATGYDVRDIFGDATPDDVTDDVPEPPTEPIAKEGELWALGAHRILCADAFVEENRKRLFDGKLMDLVVTDPPYAIYGSSTGIGADIADDKMVRPFFEGMFRFIVHNLREFGHCYVCCDWRSWASIWESANRAEMSPKNCIVWDKKSSGLGSNYANTHEFVGFFARLPPPQAMKNTGRKGQRMVHHPNMIRLDRVRGDERQHNAAKPVELFKQLIENSSVEGESVCDYFLGSGTTILAAEKTGRIAYGFEMKPKFVDVSIVRWEHMTGQKARRVA